MLLLKENYISWRLQVPKDRVIVKLEGIDRIEDAERLKNKFMEIHREDAVELEEDCYFLADLRECTVFDTEGKELDKYMMLFKLRIMMYIG